MEAYLDYNATSPLDPRVFDAMTPYLTRQFGNASSFHKRGQAARNAVEEAREEIAGTLGVEPGDIVFTSGGTESDNLALKGVLRSQATRTGLVVTSVEHQAVLHSAQYLASGKKFNVKIVPVGPDGLVDLNKLKEVIDDDTALVSVMHANNETGTIQPVAEAAKLAKVRGALFHTDAVQSYGRIAFDASALGADLLTISAHKICGPKGAGALYVRKGVKLKAVLHGGHQEKNVRPGTENVAAIAGFGAAARLAAQERESDAVRIGALRDRLERGILEKIPGARVNGTREHRLYNTTNLSFEGLEGETLLMNLDLKGIYTSTGSACTAGSIEPSHVLLALGLPEGLARAAIRFSLGRFTAGVEVDHALAELPGVVERLRKASPARMAVLPRSAEPR